MKKKKNFIPSCLDGKSHESDHKTTLLFCSKGRQSRMTRKESGDGDGCGGIDGGRGGETGEKIQLHFV